MSNNIEINTNEWINWIKEAVNKDLLKYYDYKYFSDIQEIGPGRFGKVFRANWRNSNYLALKCASVKDIVHELKLQKEINFHDNIIKFCGVTVESENKNGQNGLVENYMLVMEYANGGTLKEYLKKNFKNLNWDDKYNLAYQLSCGISCLHNEGIVHHDLHSRNVLVHRDTIKLTDFGFSERIDTSSASSKQSDVYGIVPYVDPVKLREKKCSLNEKSDVYSTGVLLWEISSGQSPFCSENYDCHLIMKISEGEREKPTPDTPEDYVKIYTECWDGEPDNRPTINQVMERLEITIKKPNIMTENCQTENFQLSISDKQELMASSASSVSGLSDNLSHGELSQIIQNFDKMQSNEIDPITSTDELSSKMSLSNEIILEELQNFQDNFSKVVSHKKFLALINEFENILDEVDEIAREAEHNKQICELFRGRVYDMEYYIKLMFSPKNRDCQVDHFSITLQPNRLDYRIVTPFSLSQGNTIFFNSRSKNGIKLINWSYNSIKIEIIKPIINVNGSKKVNSVSNVISYSGDYTIDIFNVSSDYQNPKVDNEKEVEYSFGLIGYNLTKENFDSIYVNIMKWMKEFIVNKYFELTNIKKKIAIDLVNIPDIYSIDESCLNIMKPTTNLKEFLIPNDGKRCDNNSNYGDYTMKYKICLNKNDIEPSEEFKQAIEQAIEGMKPLIFLKDLFDEYGLFFPLSIILGKSLKNTLPNSSLPFNFENFENLEKVDLESPPSFTSLRSFLRKLNISYSLPKKGIFVKISDLSDWIRNIDNNLEIIEFDNVIPLYEILEAGQQRKIDYILNTKDNFKIIMTGLADLKDFNIDTENEKRINIDPTLEDGNYEVFGSIISKKSHSRLDEFFVTFKLYDFSGFSAIINKLLETNANIKECYILWIIIGNPSSLSVFSPKNRDCQVDYFSITLQPNLLDYRIVTPFSLPQGSTIFFNSHLPNFEPNNGIKLVNWSYNSIKIEIIKPIINVNELNKVYSASSVISNSYDYKIDILCISSNYKNFKIDNEKEDEVPIWSIGHNLTKENFVKELMIIFPFTIPFTKFLPLIDEIRNIRNEVIEITQAAEYNKRICNALKQRVHAVDLAVFDLKVQRNNQEYFGGNNYLHLQNLITIITNIKKFMKNISQMITLLKLKYILPENIEKILKELCEDFDVCIIKIEASNFTTTIKDEIRPEEDEQNLKADQDDLNKYFGQIVGVDDKDKEEMISKINKISIMKSTMEKLLDKQLDNEYNQKKSQSKIDEIFQAHQIIFSDYKKTDKKPRKDGIVTKWVSVKNEDEEYAFKSISEENKISVQNQVIILRELHNCQNIIKFYGLTNYENKWYLVTEWAEHGNLREFYTNNKNLFDPKLKLRISLDIARGLNFLRTVEFLHRDIRAENVLITNNNTAKLTNFKSSRSYKADTQNQDNNLEQMRYCAPEILQRTSGFKYNNKCEVYSFGILLWEISEEKTPYENHDDFVEITKLVLEKHRESFSENNQMPDEFKNLALDAVDHNPESRPKLTTMFIVLSDCLESFDSHTSSSKYMTHAAEETKKHEMFGLITEIRDLLDKIGELVQAAEHNKRICKALKQRVYVVYLSILDLKDHGDDKECFNENNRQCLQNLVDVIKKIREFVNYVKNLTII
ncbi:kinase-like protein [Rhizophagus irregularis]|nr:kinase-like protein [Rhizophagus irregularis]